MEERNIVVITGPSGSGKTTLENKLVEEEGYKRVASFTTRQPRNDEELDSYIFLTKEQFKTKMFNGDFIEYETYEGNAYALGPIPEEGNVVMVLTPAGREQVRKWAVMKGQTINTFFLSISEEEVANRLRKRGDEEGSISYRLKDLAWMSPSNSCTILNAEGTTNSLFSVIHNNNGV